MIAVSAIVSSRAWLLCASSEGPDIDRKRQTDPKSPTLMPSGCLTLPARKQFWTLGARVCFVCVCLLNFYLDVRGQEHTTHFLQSCKFKKRRLVGASCWKVLRTHPYLQSCKYGCVEVIHCTSLLTRRAEITLSGQLEE